MTEITTNTRIKFTSPDGKVEFGTVRSVTNPGFGPRSALVLFDDGTFCNVPLFACRTI